MAAHDPEILSAVTLDPLPTSNEGGCREVIGIAFPLIVSTASVTMMLFVDRMFLSWYGQASVAAAVPGGILFWTMCSLFYGSAQYVNTIVAQYHGAGNRPACARAVWQGVFFSVMAAPVILACIPVGWVIIDWSGHGPEVLALEREYFAILMVGGVALPFGAALSSFFSGRGRTGVVMWGNLLGSVVNVGLDYAFIFGKFGVPEMGIRGAAIATAMAGFVPVIFWGVLFLGPRYQARYRTRRELGWNRGVFVMLLRYGVPAGTQMFLDAAAFTFFVMLVGRIGEEELVATNIVLTIELVSFLPMVGMSIATSILVGEYIGRGKPLLAERSAYSAFKLALAYVLPLSVFYAAFPEFLLGLFSPESGNGDSFRKVADTGVILLRFVAAYTVFESLFVVFSGALKGAGDTRFAMWAQTILAWGFLALPVYVVVNVLNLGVYAAWVCLLAYVVLLGSLFMFRFRWGYWKTIRMVEG